MVITDLTYDERRRFRKASVCPICNCFIEDFDAFELVKSKYGRYTVYTFMHKVCLKRFHEEVLHDKLVVDNQGGTDE